MNIKKSKVSKSLIAVMLILAFALSIMPMTVFATTEISNVSISVNFDYKAGDEPKTTAARNDEFAPHYDIEYEYWEEMETTESGESVPVKYWYSDESRNNAVSSDKKITTFEEGKTYMYSISLKAKDGYTFATNCPVTVNGTSVNSVNVTNTNNGTGLFVAAVKTIKPVKPVTKKPVELIEVTGVTTEFNVGDKPVFTGKVAENSLYEIDNESWAGIDHGIITSSEYWNNRYKDWGNPLITSFRANTIYSYAIYLKLTDDAVANGYYFDKDKTKLSINGKVITMDPDSVNIDADNDVVAWFYNVLTMTPTENTPTQPTQETGKETQSTEKTKTNVEEKVEQTINATNNPKTADNIMTSVMFFVVSIVAIGTLAVVNRKKLKK